MYPLYFLFPLILLTSCDNGTLHQSRSKRSAGVAIPRVQLLKEALGWMTFRKNGQLMTDAQLEPLFLEPLVKNKYRPSTFYRTFVVAFQHGVLPRLTLNENARCNPDYTLEYKDPYNSSVTWHYQKKFTFDAYKKRDSSDAQFCDYRQGLVCKSSTKKCECPDGAEMKAIEIGSPMKRCLLRQNVTCALIDLDHGNDPKHLALASKLYRVIFNLEKPLGCQVGTQCRFKEENKRTPKCYNVNGGPWHLPPPVTSGGSNSLSFRTVDMAAFENFQQILDVVGVNEPELNHEYLIHDNKILKDHPDTGCSWMPTRGARGSCPVGMVCYDDYSDDRGMYPSDCNLDSLSERLERSCHETMDGIPFGKCEGPNLDQRGLQEFENMVEYAHLGRGQPCRIELESEIQNWKKTGRSTSTLNKYKFLTTLEEDRSTGGGAGYCDRTKLLTCSEDKMECECVKGTAPRIVTVDGEEYQSDYCYVEKSTCRPNMAELMPLTKAEERLISEHYGTDEFGGVCTRNACVLVDEETERCSSENTGDIGQAGLDKPQTEDAGGAGGVGGMRGSMMLTGWSVVASGLLSRLV